MLRGLGAMGCIASRALPSARLSHQVLTVPQPRAAALYRATIESVRDVAGTDIRLLRLRAHEALAEDAGPQSVTLSSPHEAFSYAAGQWVDVHIPGIHTIGGYSFISAPTPMPASISRVLDSPQLPFFDLAVKKARYPPAAWIHSSACVDGAAVAVRVGGKFTLLPALPPSQAVSERSGEKRVQEAAPHILLIAGGVGINPLYSMLLQLAATGGRLSKPEMHGCSSSSSASVSLQPHVTLLWSIRTLQDAFLLPQLRALASSVGGSDSPLAGRLRLILALTRQRAAADEGIGLCDASEPMLVSGRISPVLLQGLLRAAADGDFKLSSSKIFAEQSYAQHSLPVVSSSATRPPGSHHAFVCGPPSMTENLLKMLREDCGFKGEGVDVHIERWW